MTLFLSSNEVWPSIVGCVIAGVIIYRYEILDSENPKKSKVITEKKVSASHAAEFDKIAPSWDRAGLVVGAEGLLRAGVSADQLKYIYDKDIVDEAVERYKLPQT